MQQTERQQHSTPSPHNSLQLDVSISPFQSTYSTRVPSTLLTFPWLKEQEGPSLGLSITAIHRNLLERCQYVMATKSPPIVLVGERLR